MRRPSLALVASVLCGLSLPSCAASPAPIAITLPEPPGRAPVENFPVTLGMVFPEGELPANTSGVLRDDRGQTVPVETKPTAWWSPGKTSVKWLRLHFRASTNRTYSFDPGAPSRSTPGVPLAVQNGERILVNTGALSVSLGSAPGLFEQIALHGVPLAKPAQSLVWLTDAQGARHTPQKWTLQLEEATPMQACVKATSTLQGPTAQPLARSEVRLEFFAGEPWVRLSHTLTWLVKDVNVEAAEYGLAFAPQLQSGQMQIGVEGKAPLELPLLPQGKVLAVQPQESQFFVASGEKRVLEGAHLAGWMALRNGTGRGTAVFLRDAWQNYPAGLEMDGGVLRVKLWANEGGNLSFKPEAIMPPDYYNNPIWEKLPRTKEAKHFIHEFDGQSNFLHTGEGVAKTHELTLLFFDPQTKRSISEMDSITQHPVVARQDPASAMRVPFMGFHFTAVNREQYPAQEAAAEQVGRMTVARWPQVHSYGFFRFGGIIDGHPGNPWDFYRWFDGVQYNLQIIPWLLFLRGGDRDFYEEGQITARHAMDIETNHYNTRGVPIGYMSNAAGMPFPWEPIHLGLGQCIHFLSYSYHLTGDRRAKEVMDEIIDGTKEAALKMGSLDTPDKPYIPAEHGRYLYNINEFWADAYAETWDPQIAQLAKAWRDASVRTEFNPQTKMFRNSRMYLFEGLVPLWNRWPDKALRDAMLAQLDTAGYKYLQNGGAYDLSLAVGANWARRVDPSPNWDAVSAQLGARISDLVPRGELPTKTVADYPFPGHEMLRDRLFPILTGLAAAPHGDVKNVTPRFRDFYMGLQEDGKLGGRGAAWLRARNDGDIKLRLLANSDKPMPPRPIEVEIRDAHGAVVTNVVLKEAPEDAQLKRMHYETYNPPQAEITIPNAKQGAIYHMLLQGGDARWSVLVLTDAQLVHEWQPKTLYYIMCQAGQYYYGTRFYGRAAGDTITVSGAPYSIRDATTGALIYQFAFGDPVPLSHKVKPGQLLEFTAPGDGRRRFGVDGLQPFVSALPEMWFNPRQP